MALKSTTAMDREEPAMPPVVKSPSVAFYRRSLHLRQVKRTQSNGIENTFKSFHAVNQLNRLLKGAFEVNEGLTIF